MLQTAEKKNKCKILFKQNAPSFATSDSVGNVTESGGTFKPTFSSNSITEDPKKPEALKDIRQLAVDNYRHYNDDDHTTTTEAQTTMHTTTTTALKYCTKMT